MTGGSAVILGKVGRNFGAGMTGGMAYVYNAYDTFNINCNKKGLNIEGVKLTDDISELKSLVENHYKATLSPLAKRILGNWQIHLPKFIKVLPEEYKQALLRLANENLVE